MTTIDHSPTTEIWGTNVEPVIGKAVRPDGWRMYGKLEAGLEGFCPFYITTNNGGPIKHVAVRVEVTGRTLQRTDIYFKGTGGDRGVRVKITFVGDGEPDTVVGGWMEVPYR